MMKHGFIGLALWCCLIPAWAGGLTPLTLAECEAIDGGDTMLSVDRDRQMMTVTRITPGNYDNIECYSVKVTTSVVRTKDLSDSNPKGAMENKNRTLTNSDSSLIPPGEARTPTQFPTGTAKLSPTIGTQAKVTGPVIRTDATQMVSVTGNKEGATKVLDGGYNVHYVPPVFATNTFGCVGVQSLASMNRIAQTVKADAAAAPASRPAVQTITVSAYTNNTPPPKATFMATEVKSTPVAATKPATSKPATSTLAPVTTSSKPWWQVW